MPKIPTSTRTKLENYVKLFGRDTFSTDGKVLLCKICEKDVKCSQKSQVTQHLNGILHKAKLDRGASSLSLIQLPSLVQAQGKQSKYSIELSNAFVAADIPLHKLENSVLKKFLQEWTKQITPSPVTLRLNYVKVLYESKLEFIRESIRGKPIWISMDETTDVTGRYVAHTVVGTLETVESRSFLLHAEHLEKTNASTITQAFINALMILWPAGLEHDKVLLFTTDGAAYMKSAGNTLKAIFPKMLHVTCATHALHRIAEEVRIMFPNVDKLVANGKKIFLKSASRATVFRETAPGIPLPPQPILTRWGSWIRGAIYYAENFEAFSSVVDNLDPREASSIHIVQELTRSKPPDADLAYIRTNFASLPPAIERLEKQGRPLVDSLAVFNDTLQDLRKISGDRGDKIRSKIDSVLRRNPDLKVLERISGLINGSSDENDLQYTPMELSSMKFAPITSVDVERSFSRLKHTLNDRRQSLTFENLKHLLIVHCNQ